MLPKWFSKAWLAVGIAVTCMDRSPYQCVSVGLRTDPTRTDPELALLMEDIKLLITEDEPVARQATAKLFDCESDIKVVGAAENGETAVDLARSLMPDVALMDIRMPKLDGIRATQIIKQEEPRTAVVILTMYDDATVFDPIKAGAISNILKVSPVEDALEAVMAAY
ncbi:MAG: response regulator [Armatimonadota bacterium]